MEVSLRLPRGDCGEVFARRIGTLHAIVKSPFIYFNAPWYTKAFSPKSSLTDLLSSGLNNPNTDEPDPVIAAYIAPASYSFSLISLIAGNWGNTPFFEIVHHSFFPFLYRLLYDFFQWNFLPMRLYLRKSITSGDKDIRFY